MRNTEDAEKSAQTPSSGRGQGKGVWGMLEESELAKSIRQDEKKKVDEPVDNFTLQNGTPANIPSPDKQSEDSIVIQARSRRDELEAILTGSSSVSSDLTSAAQAPDATTASVIESAKEASKALMDLIEQTTDPTRLEALLALNDNLTGLLARSVPQPSKLQGLGVVIDTGSPDSAEGVIINGHSPGIAGEESGIEDEEEPVTPRIDKGKGRAEPEPEFPEPVLSTPFLVAESDEEDGEAHLAVSDEIEDAISPTDRYV